MPEEKVTKIKLKCGVKVKYKFKDYLNGAHSFTIIDCDTGTIQSVRNDEGELILGVDEVEILIDIETLPKIINFLKAVNEAHKTGRIINQEKLIKDLT